jgi:probable rRNA maturation factor
LKIIFKNNNVPSPLKNKKAVKILLISIFKKELVDFEHITYIFCTDSYLLDLNRTFLKHHTLTDILTFPLSEPNQPIIAEIYLSTERVKENSFLFNTDFNHEIIRVIIHGTLHLCNYNDRTKAQKKKMRLKENFYLNQYSFT